MTSVSLRIFWSRRDTVAAHHESWWFSSRRNWLNWGPTRGRWACFLHDPFFADQWQGHGSNYVTLQTHCFEDQHSIVCIHVLSLFVF